MCFYCKDTLRNKVFTRNDCARICFISDFLCIMTAEDELHQYDLRLLRKDMNGSVYFKDSGIDLESVLMNTVDKPTIFKHRKSMWNLKDFIVYILSNMTEC